MRLKVNHRKYRFKAQMCENVYAWNACASWMGENEHAQVRERLNAVTTKLQQKKKKKNVKLQTDSQFHTCMNNKINVLNPFGQTSINYAYESTGSFWVENETHKYLNSAIALGLFTREWVAERARTTVMAQTCPQRHYFICKHRIQ